MKRRCQVVYYPFDIIWLNGCDLRELPLLDCKKVLRRVLPRKSSWVGCLSYVDFLPLINTKFMLRLTGSLILSR